METPDGRGTRAARRGGQLRRRPTDAADEPLLDRLRPAHRQPCLQSRRDAAPSKRRRGRRRRRVRRNDAAAPVATSAPAAHVPPGAAAAAAATAAAVR